MAKRRSSNNSHIGRSVAAFLLALVVIGACVIGGLQLWGKGNQKPSEWFKKKEASAEPRPEYSTVLPTNGGMTMPEEIGADTSDESGNKSQGIALMSAAIPVAQYAAYGVSPAAENAKTVTATVSPDNEASNTKIKWELAWKNPASEWATGKQPSEYIKLQTNADDLMESKKCTVSCLQAFGEQLELKAVAVDDETKFATVNVDYVQQVKSVKVNIGDVSVNLGGNTDITIAIRRDYGGEGGKVTVTPTMGDVYTLENTVTSTASFTHSGVQDPRSKWLAYHTTVAGAPGGTTIDISYKDKIGEDTEIIGENIYFDRRLFTQFDFSDTASMFTSTDKIKELVTNFNTETVYDGPFKGKVIWQMTVTLSSEEYEYEYTYQSELVWAAIDETVPVTDVQINDGNDLLFP